MLSATHLHAMIVHFPIALLLAGFLSEVISLFNKREFFRQGSFFLLLLGTLGAAAAFLSGNIAGDGMDEGALGQAMELHEQAALITLLISMVALAFRISAPYLKWKETRKRTLGVALYTLAIAAVSLTGYRGGELVFSHAAGVELAIPDFSQVEPD
ncbi:MAG: hypothetical protein IPH04_09245 [Saprospirales bacterium]|nr:hypothetical protein [Saprospirales bacterium]MBK6902978.1 hypothetical protein [Saprospirales bacterium]MBK7337747.1 hypothetical protein [Saprospirales bacterium]